jgi:hypothetical protein
VSLAERTLPRPALNVRPGVYLGGSDEALLLRPYGYTDGDGTNAVINMGVQLGTKHGDPLLDLGLDLVIPPCLFWLIDPLIRLAERTARPA